MSFIHEKHIHVYAVMYVRSFIKYLIIVLTICAFRVNAQHIDNTSTFKTIVSNNYFRFQYDNDFFTKEDRYYSQGISFEFVHPALKKNPISKLLIKTSNSHLVYGVSFNILGYTPTSILSESILFGDRPYAAVLSIKSFMTATDTLKQKRVSTGFSIGVIGPAALGKEIQVNIHRWLNNPLPKGWNAQVQNDIVLNYQVNYEKKLWAVQDNFLLNGAGELRIGSLDDRFGMGVNFMAGRFKDFYRTSSHNRKPEFYLYGQAITHLIAYNASLQGGVFNRKSTYTITNANIERIIFQADAGIVINFRKISLAYSQSFLTKEFKTGNHHRWGGFTIGFVW